MEKLQVSNRAKNIIASPMRKFLPLIREAEKKGIKVFKLNVGDPDLETPKVFLKAIKSYHKKTLPYAPSSGILEHVKAWQKYYSQFGVKLPLENIIPTVGGAEAILLSLMAITNPGDEIIIFEPLYTSYRSFAVILGIKLVPITLSIANNFSLPAASQIERKISKRTKAVVIVNPDNPTGKLWSEKELQAIIKIAKRYNLFVISDETYREIRFDGKKPFCLLARKDARQNVIVCDSVSKRFSMPGARIGCVASFNNEVMRGILKFAQARLSAPTLEQLATIPLLSSSRFYTNKIRKEYLRRQKTIAKGLDKIKGTVFKPTQGAFYQAVKMPVKDAEDFVKFMISEFSYKGKTVMVTPMRDFYITPGLGQSEIRIAFVLGIRELKEAMEILQKGLEAYIRQA